MITFATMYPVDTQAISSSVAPRFPIMWGIATFTMLVSSSSSTEASETVIAIRYRYLYRSSAAPSMALRGSAAVVTGPLLGRDGDVDAHAGPQCAGAAIARAVGADPDGHPLHDLREIPRRVVRRQQRELRTSSGGQALHPPVEQAPGIRVDGELDRLAGLHVRGLCLLQVRHHPDVLERHDAHQRLAGLDQLAHLDGLLAHHAARRREQARVGELQRGLVARRTRRGDPSVRPDEGDLGR